MSKVTFDLDRMHAAAGQLYVVRTKMEALAERASHIDAEGVKDPVMKSLLTTAGRRHQLMAAGDARELAACEHSVRGAEKRALAFDAPSRRPSRAKAKHKPKPGGKVRPGGGDGRKMGYPGDHASKQQMACWLASRAAGMGAPPELLVSAALVESTLQNVDHGLEASTGLFQIQVTIHKVPPGFGSASGTLQSKDWWQQHPDAQVTWFQSAVAQTKGQGRGPNTSGGAAVGAWAADIERPAAQYRGRYAARYDDAHRLVSNCHSGSGSGSGGTGAGQKPAGGHKPSPGGSKPGALGRTIADSARKMLGIEHRRGEFAQMQGRVGSPVGAFWCAAFAYSAVLNAGKHLPGGRGGGWAAVATWVNHARRHEAGLKLVSASDARPGDLVAFDWDGGGDFGRKGHIGVMESGVHDGAFTTVEGNTGNGVSATNHRSVHAPPPDVVFIRVAA